MKPDQHALRTLPLFLFAAVGCSTDPPVVPAMPATEVPLRFEKRDVDLGIVHEDRSLRYPFRFRVWEKGPVRIEYASTTCCGANLIDPPVAGKVFEAGTEGSITLVLTGDNYRQKKAVVAIIETSPPSQDPITLSLRALIAPPPMVHPRPVVLESVLPDAPAGTVTVSRLRTSDMRALELDISRSDVSPFELVDLTSDTMRVGHPNNTPQSFADAITFKLIDSMEQGIQHERREVILAWKEDLPDVKVPVIVRRKHPCQPKLNRLFCGELRPGMTSSIQVPLLRLRDVQVASIASESDYVNATINESGNMLEVVVGGPDMRAVGRFDVPLTLTFDDPTLPPIIIHVAGICASASAGDAQ
jgi:hypothetical protein